MVVEPLGPGDPQIIAGYVLQGLLGTGGMGAVYLSATRGGQPVAIKTVRPDLAMDPRFRQRFEQEVHAARRVRGRYIANVVDSNTEGHMPWLATEYVPGPSLAQAIAARGPLPVRTCLGLAAGVGKALETIHAVRVIHRDLKPGNVVLTHNDLSLIDFGIARALDVTSLTGAHTRIGTPAFMAPEQIKRSAPTTSAADVFSLGLTVHVAATGIHPFQEELFAAVPYLHGGVPDLSACPEPLRPLIHRCLAMEPADRPTATEVVAGCLATGDQYGLTEVFPEAGWLPEQFTVVSAPVPQPVGHTPGPPGGTVSPGGTAAPPPPRGTATKRLAWGAALLAVAGVAAGIYLAAPWDVDGTRGDPAAEGGPAPSDSQPDTADDHQPDNEANTPDSATEEPSDDAIESGRRLKDRVKNGLKDCRTAEALYEIDGARVTLSCTPRHGADHLLSEAEASSIIVHTASFPIENYDEYEAFLNQQEAEVLDDGTPSAPQTPSAIVLTHDDFPYQGPVENSEGIGIGEVFAHESTLGFSTISWTFVNDYYVDAHAEYFVIVAESLDRDTLVTWWNTWPI